MLHLNDAAGNMISGPRPGDETARRHFTYDAWNRLVAVYADDEQNSGEPGDLVAEYQVDGRGRRVAKLIPSGGNWDHTDCYYENRDSHEWHENKRNPL